MSKPTGWNRPLHFAGVAGCRLDFSILCRLFRQSMGVARMWEGGEIQAAA
jgi:hypothetical protein